MWTPRLREVSSQHFVLVCCTLLNKLKPLKEPSVHYSTNSYLGWFYNQPNILLVFYKTKFNFAPDFTPPWFLIGWSVELLTDAAFRVWYLWRKFALRTDLILLFKDMFVANCAALIDNDITLTGSVTAEWPDTEQAVCLYVCVCVY